MIRRVIPAAQASDGEDDRSRARVLVLPAWRARAISAAWVAASVGAEPPFTPQLVDLGLTAAALAATVGLNLFPGLKKRLPRVTLEQAGL